MKFLSLIALSLIIVSCGEKTPESRTSSVKTTKDTVQVTPASPSGLVTPPVPKM